MELNLVAPKLKSDYSTKPWTFPPVVVISGYGLHAGKVGGVIHLRNSGASWRQINDFCGWAKDSDMPERYSKVACMQTDKLDNILSF